MSPKPSEATRLAELDERIRRDCARSGVPFHVQADYLLERVADQIELGWADTESPATQRHQGKGGRQLAPAAATVAQVATTRATTTTPEMRNGAPDLDAVPEPVSPATEETHGQHSG